jgi:hypothetical protein
MLTFKPGLCLGIAITFLVNLAFPGNLSAQELMLSRPGEMVHLSQSFHPPVLKGIKVYPDNPFRFDFILDQGDSTSPQEQIKEEANKLIRYFMASITVPEGDLWVNLSPYEKDRIVPESFGQTDMGRDLLAQDYILKQITASLIYPEDEIGKKFWNRIYEEAAKKFGRTDIPINTFNKVWIVPEKADVYENAKAGTAYVVESKLKVMLEEDYLSQQKNGARHHLSDVNQLGNKIVREVVIPQLTKEVNEGANFAQLRQVYQSLILAAWYKKKIKDSILTEVYADQNKIFGININDPQQKQKIYEQYLQAFKKGAYNYIKEEKDISTGQTLPRKYFSGGVGFNAAMTAFQYTSHLPAIPKAAVRVTVDMAMANRKITKQAAINRRATRNKNMMVYLPESQEAFVSKEIADGHTNVRKVNEKDQAMYADNFNVGEILSEIHQTHPLFRLIEYTEKLHKRCYKAGGAAEEFYDKTYRLILALVNGPADRNFTKETFLSGDLTAMRAQRLSDQPISHLLLSGVLESRRVYDVKTGDIANDPQWKDVVSALRKVMKVDQVELLWPARAFKVAKYLLHRVQEMQTAPLSSYTYADSRYTITLLDYEKFAKENNVHPSEVAEVASYLIQKFFKGKSKKETEKTPGIGFTRYGVISFYADKTADKIPDVWKEFARWLKDNWNHESAFEGDFKEEAGNSKHYYHVWLLPGQSRRMRIAFPFYKDKYVTIARDSSGHIYVTLDGEKQELKPFNSAPWDPFDSTKRPSERMPYKFTFNLQSISMEDVLRLPPGSMSQCIAERIVKGGTDMDVPIDIKDNGDGEVTVSAHYFPFIFSEVENDPAMMTGLSTQREEDISTIRSALQNQLTNVLAGNSKIILDAIVALDQLKERTDKYADQTISLIARFKDVRGIARFIIQAASANQNHPRGLFAELGHAAFLQDQGFTIIRFGLSFGIQKETILQSDMLVERDGMYYFVEVSNHNSAAYTPDELMLEFLKAGRMRRYQYILDSVRLDSFAARQLRKMIGNDQYRKFFKSFQEFGPQIISSISLNFTNRESSAQSKWFMEQLATSPLMHVQAFEHGLQPTIIIRAFDSHLSQIEEPLVFSKRMQAQELDVNDKSKLLSKLSELMEHSYFCRLGIQFEKDDGKISNLSYGPLDSIKPNEQDPEESILIFDNDFKIPLKKIKYMTVHYLPKPDSAQLGGIDLNPTDKALQVQDKDGKILFHTDSTMLEQYRNAPGFTPVILNILPLNNVREFLGAAQ